MLASVGRALEIAESHLRGCIIEAQVVSMACDDIHVCSRHTDGVCHFVIALGEPVLIGRCEPNVFPTCTLDRIVATVLGNGERVFGVGGDGVSTDVDALVASSLVKCGE